MGKHRKPSRFTQKHRNAIACAACVGAFLVTGAVCVDAALDSAQSSSGESEVTPLQPINKDSLVAITPAAPFNSDSIEQTPPAVSITLEPQPSTAQSELKIMPAAAFMACKAEHQLSCPAVVFNG